MDPITLSVLQGALVNIVDEMDLRLIRGAISPIISDSKDMANGIFDAKSGEMLAQGRYGLPVFLAQMQYTVENCLPKVEDGGGFSPGDIWITNDVYDGGSHLNDIQLLAPVFRDNELVCLLANTGHWQDIGGSRPGAWAPHATDIREEGMAIPPVPLYRAGQRNEALLEAILANVRLADDMLGDLEAMRAALREGNQRLQELLEKYSIDLFREGTAELAEKAESSFRDRIRGLPDGNYSFSDYLDNDGVSDSPIEIRASVEIAGDELTIDFSGTAPAQRGPMNLGRNTTVAGCLISLLHVFNDVTPNGGTLRAFDVAIPEDSCLNARNPRPVSGYLEVLGRVIESVWGALAKAAPDVVNAACFGTSALLTVSGHDSDGKMFAATYPYPGGYGGSPHGDGLVHGPTPQSMARCFSIELAERRFPLLVREWALRPDSGGAGRFRGGCGTSYTIEMTLDDCSAIVLGDRVDHAPFGVVGGLPAAPNELWFETQGERWTPPLRSKATDVALDSGDRVHLGSPGGGGYGKPAERPIEAIERDLCLGYVTPARAAQDYGVDVEVLEGTDGRNEYRCKRKPQ